MKALIGVDALGQCSSAIELIRRLDFPLEKVVLLHGIEMIVPDDTIPAMAGATGYPELVAEFEAAGEQALDEAARMCGEGLPIEKRVLPGDPLHALLEAADDEGIDLIGVGTYHKSTLQAMLMGSVTRGLLTASTHSFLAAKEGYRSEGPLTCVLATDHSPYADRAADVLASFGPKGIGRLIVLSVIDPKAQRSLKPVPGDEDLTHAQLWSEERMRRANQNLCSKLQGVVAACEERVERGQVNAVIKQVMEDTQADLLIMGAQGHGFFDRLKSGSVSFHQVVAENYSVLVLRP